MSNTILPPLEAAGLTKGTVRICIRLIALDHKSNPSRYSYPPSGILKLAEEWRKDIPLLYAYFVYIAKAVASGLSMEQVRHAPIEWTVRSVAKRRPVVAGRGR